MVDIQFIKAKFAQAQRLVEGYDPVNVLFDLFVPLFGDTRVLQKKGLVKQYIILKEKVVTENLIELIIYGANIEEQRDRVIDDYPTLNNDIITLSVKSLCSSFLKDHILESEVESLLEKNK